MLWYYSRIILLYSLIMVIKVSLVCSISWSVFVSIIPCHRTRPKIQLLFSIVHGAKPPPRIHTVAAQVQNQTYILLPLTRTQWTDSLWVACTTSFQKKAIVTRAMIKRSSKATKELFLATKVVVAPSIRVMKIPCGRILLCGTDIMYTLTVLASRRMTLP